jgi:hypothetical protein
MSKQKTLSFTLWVHRVCADCSGTGVPVRAAATAQALALPGAPGWTNWLFGMMAARFLPVAFVVLLLWWHPRSPRTA